MSWIDTFKSLKSSEHRLAWLVAMTADAIQIIGFPIFVEGAGSPRSRFSGRDRPHSPTGMALGISALAGGRTDPRDGSVSDLDGCGLVCDSATDASGGAGDSATRTGTGSETVKRAFRT